MFGTLQSPAVAAGLAIESVASPPYIVGPPVGMTTLEDEEDSFGFNAGPPPGVTMLEDIGAPPSATMLIVEDCFGVNTGPTDGMEIEEELEDKDGIVGFIGVPPPATMLIVPEDSDPNFGMEIEEELEDKDVVAGFIVVPPFGMAMSWFGIIDDLPTP